jgi:hypothetical protein
MPARQNDDVSCFLRSVAIAKSRDEKTREQALSRRE